MLEKKVIPKAPVFENWLEGYNMSVTAEEKMQYLQIGLEEEKTPENLLRQKLYERRFLKNGKVTGADYFMVQWKELEFILQKLGGRFGRQKAIRAVDDVCEFLLIPEGTTDSLKEVLLQEYINLVCLYIMLCQEDRNYKSIIFGFGTISDVRLVNKIAHDIYRVGCGTALVSGKTKELELVMKATEDAFRSVFPGQEAHWENARADFANEYRL